MFSPDIATASSIGDRLGKALAYSALSLTLAANSCEPVTTTSTPSPATFQFSEGTKFLGEPNGSSDICAVLDEPASGTRIRLVTTRDGRGTTVQTYGGYLATELDLCPNDPDGFVWRDEGLETNPWRNH